MTTLTAPHDLLAAVPFLIGYHPEDSLVLVAIQNETIGLAMRVDYKESYDQDQINFLVNHLIREGADSALIVLYLPGKTPDEGTIDSIIIESFRSVMVDHGIALQEALLVSNGRWRSALCLDLQCCPLTGNKLPELSDSIVTVEQIYAGKALPFADSQQMSDSLHADRDDEAIIACLKDLESQEESQESNTANSGKHENLQEFQRSGARAVNDLLRDFTTHRALKNVQAVALVLFSLLDLQVRDYALGIANPENTLVLLDLWSSLTRIAPEGYAAAPATLYAELLYESGSGALATKALERAFEDCPDYPLAKLLKRTFSAGWPPSNFVAMRSELHPKIFKAIFGESE